MFTLVIPVYRNERSIGELITVVSELALQLEGQLQAVFVDDGSPDGSGQRLAELLPSARFPSRVVTLSRNFGALAAVRAGLAAGDGEYFAVMAADLQEPPELIRSFFLMLREGQHDVVVGTRDKRADPAVNRFLAGMFWRVYRAVVQRDVPPGGVDVFACTREFRDHVLALRERNSTLVGLIFWLGFRRGSVNYERRQRRHGVSAWSLSRKVRYLLDSTFAFSDLPIRLLGLVGLLGMGVSTLLALLVLVGRLSGRIEVPGYAATVLTVMFFGGLNSFGIGMLGEYLWRTFENTKQRPEFLALRTVEYSGK
jgi:glycosyltransferase involved in cell wall biosynthesis